MSNGSERPTPPEERVQRAVYTVALSAVATNNITDLEALSGTIHATHTLGRHAGLTDEETFDWIRKTVNFMEALLAAEKAADDLKK